MLKNFLLSRSTNKYTRKLMSLGDPVSKLISPKNVNIQQQLFCYPVDNSCVIDLLTCSGDSGNSLYTSRLLRDKNVTLGCAFQVICSCMYN